MNPDTTTMKTMQIDLPAGSKLWLEDQIWEFDEATTITVESPTAPGVSEDSP